MWFFAQIRHELCEIGEGRMKLMAYQVAVGTYYHPLRQDLQKQTALIRLSVPERLISAIENVRFQLLSQVP
jgi:hypothetical protein